MKDVFSDDLKCNVNPYLQKKQTKQNKKQTTNLPSSNVNYSLISNKWQFLHCNYTQLQCLVFYGAVMGMIFTGKKLLPQYNMSRATAFPTRLHVRPAKTQINLRVRSGW